MCAINPKFKRFFRLAFYSSHGDQATFDELLNERLIWMEQAFNASGGIRVHVNDISPDFDESEWRMIHNALAGYQCTTRVSALRKATQQLMDRIRDQHIAPNEQNTIPTTPPDAQGL